MSKYRDGYLFGIFKRNSVALVRVIRCFSNGFISCFLWIPQHSSDLAL